MRRSSRSTQRVVRRLDNRVFHQEPDIGSKMRQNKERPTRSLVKDRPKQVKELNFY